MYKSNRKKKKQIEKNIFSFLKFVIWIVGQEKVSFEEKKFLQQKKRMELYKKKIPLVGHWNGMENK